MLVMYLWVIGIDVGHVFVFDVGHVFVCYRYRRWSCFCGLLVSMLVMYVCVIGIDTYNPQMHDQHRYL